MNLDIKSGDLGETPRKGQPTCKDRPRWPTPKPIHTTESSMHGLKRFTLALAALLAALLAGAPALAQDAPDIAGIWSGAVAVPTGDLRFVVYVERGEDGALKAQIESFDQNPGNKTEIAVADGKLTFAIAPIGAHYEGTWDAAAQAWKGTLTQGQAMQLDLVRG